MSDVLFVVPSTTPNINNESIGTLLLATILKNKGINVDVFRYYEADSNGNFNLFVQNACEKILEINPRIVSFYCRCDCYLANIRISQKLKELSPQICIVFGGPQADASSVDTLRLLPWVDYCCLGEGENTIYPFINGLLSGEDVSFIDGLSYRNADGEIIVNQRPPLCADLDDAPILDYTLIPAKILEDAKMRNIPFPIDVGRGCPFNCAFCSTSIFWQRKYRLKSSLRIVKEIEHISGLYGINSFKFNHDLFTSNKGRVLDFCRCLREAGLEIDWVCSSRIDTLDAEMIEPMARAGLKTVYLGVETGSERMQKLTHKNLKIPMVLNVIDELVKNDINVIVSFIYGLPEETEDDLEQTLQLIYRMYKTKNVTTQLHFFTMLPGTEYYERYKDQLTFSLTQTNVVGDFGVKENCDFICERKELFPFYYEYTNEFRKKYANLEKYIRCCIELYDVMLSLHKDRYEHMRIADLFLELDNANADEKTSLDYQELKFNYIDRMYGEDEAMKIKEYLTFLSDVIAMYNIEDNSSEIKCYSVDLRKYSKGIQLTDLSYVPCVVCFSKKDGKLYLKIKNMN